MFISGMSELITGQLCRSTQNREESRAFNGSNAIL